MVAAGAVKVCAGGKGGFTLVDTLVGVAVFMIFAVPALQLTVRLSRRGTVRDMSVACALLQGEAQILYASAVLPPAERAMQAGPREYVIVCSHDNDTGLVGWRMGVRLRDNEIAHVAGSVYIPPVTPTSGPPGKEYQ